MLMKQPDDQTQGENTDEQPPENNQENQQETTQETPTETTPADVDSGPLLDSDESSNENTTVTNTDNSQTTETLNNNNTMADETQAAAAAPEKKEKPAKEKVEKKAPTEAVVKKDYTGLIAALVALILVVGVYVWQNYRKRKEDENTLDVSHKENGDYETEFDRNGYVRNN